MLRKIWTDPVGSKIIAAVILAVCSVIGGFWLHSNQQTKADKASISKLEETQVPENVTIHIGTPQTIAQHKAFIDPTTGFSFKIDEISNGLLWGILPGSEGVLGNDTLPNGEDGLRFRHQAGYRRPFTFGGRKFVFIIVDIDYKSQTATFRVDELVPNNNQGVSSPTK